MKNKVMLMPSLLLLPAALVVPVTAPAADLEAGDLIQISLTDRVANAPREAVHFSWPLDANAPEVEPGLRAATARSKEYRLDVSADELRAGVPLPLVSSGATVRLNPVAGASQKALAARVLAPESLVLVDPQGKALADGSAMELIAGVEDLKAAGAPFAEGTTSFRLRADLPAGQWQLRAPALAGADRYTVFVLEANSDLELTARAERPAYLAGQTLTVRAGLVQGDESLPVAEIRGLVASPDGRAFEVHWTADGDGDGYRADLPLDSAVNGRDGLWEAHLSIRAEVDGVTALRNVKTAFAVAVPTARLGDLGALGARRSLNQEGLAVTLPIEVGSAGRYQLQGVLYGTAEDGTPVALGVGQSAAWLEPGNGALELVFSDEVLNARSGVGAPYQVRDLRLLDQARMGLLELRSAGFAVSR